MPSTSPDISLEAYTPSPLLPMLRHKSLTGVPMCLLFVVIEPLNSSLTGPFCFVLEACSAWSPHLPEHKSGSNDLGVVLDTQSQLRFCLS